MSVKIKITADVDINRIINKIDDKTFWTYAASEWWKLCSKYMPNQTGNLIEDVTTRPKEFEHNVPYAARNYYNDFNFRTDKNPLATSHWDDAAISGGMDEQLIKSLQDYVDTRGFDFDD